MYEDKSLYQFTYFNSRLYLLYVNILICIMVISHKHKFIFIHNYKVAGTSITKSLSPYGIKNPTNSHILNSILGSPLVNNFEVTRRGVDILLNKSPIERIPSHITAQQLSEITSQEKWV